MFCGKWFASDDNVGKKQVHLSALKKAQEFEFSVPVRAIEILNKLYVSSWPDKIVFAEPHLISYAKAAANSIISEYNAKTGELLKN